MSIEQQTGLTPNIEETIGALDQNDRQPDQNLKNGVIVVVHNRKGINFN